jgi:hypothetical protein
MLGLRDTDLFMPLGDPRAVADHRRSTDEATLPVQSEELHTAIPGSQTDCTDKAAHLSNLEQPTAFNASPAELLQEQN